MSDLNPIHKRPTLAEVAAKAGVSRSAVSRTFTEGASVSPATRGKVQAAATALLDVRMESKKTHSKAIV